MQREARGVDVPLGTASQEQAAMKCFNKFLTLAGMNEKSLTALSMALLTETPTPKQNFYSLLTAFSIILQAKKSARSKANGGGLLAKATAQKIRDQMAGAIEERNLLANVQTMEAPGCKVQDLELLVEELAIKGVGVGFKSIHDAAILTLMWHTFGRAIDTCFARKKQLANTTSGELFLQVARIKTSVVQGVSIYKVAKRWEQCLPHVLGMLFVSTSEPSEFVFSLLPRLAVSDLPGNRTYSQEEAIIFWENLQDTHEHEAPRPTKRVRTRPNVSKYINDLFSQPSQHANKTKILKLEAALLTSGLSSHSIRRGAAAYANASPKLAIQWISTRGAWLLDSLTKVFAYIGTTTREDQSVGKVLAGYKDPDLPVVTPSARDLKHDLSVVEFAQLMTLRGQLFRNVSNFDNATMNVDDDVLDVALASLLIHLNEVTEATEEVRKVSGFTSHYIYRFYDAIERTNAALGSSISMATCVSWGSRLRTSWTTRNFAQVGTSSGGDAAVLSAAITQILYSVAGMERTLEKLVEAEEKRSGQQAETTQESDEVDIQLLPGGLKAQRVPEATTLTGCFTNWYLYALWHTATDKKQQFLRADLKACVNIMIVVYGKALYEPAAPLQCDAIAYQDWEKAVLALADEVDKTVNEKLNILDRKKPPRKAGSLRKRWRQIRLHARSSYAVLCA